MKPNHFARFTRTLANNESSRIRLAIGGDTMDAFRFDDMTRHLTATTSRRQTLAALALAALGRVGLGHEVSAGPGCKDVGIRCTNATQCCSGVCKGKQGRKRCRAHDAGSCQAGASTTFCKPGSPFVACTTSTSRAGGCVATTGKAAYCAYDMGCMACAQDADCQTVCGPHAACLACAGCAQGTACAGPDACLFV